MIRELIIILVIVFFPTLALADPPRGFLPDAIAELQYKMLVDINPHDIDARNKLGMALFRENKLQEAENQFAEVLRQAPRDFDAHDGMGLVKIKQRDFPAALSWIQKAISLSETDTMARFDLGLVYEYSGRFREAEIAYNQALAVNDQNMRIAIRLNRNAESLNRKIIIDTLRKLKMTHSQYRGDFPR